MELGNKKKIKGFLILIILITFGSTCNKKISKHPFDMEGVWFDENTGCGTVLVIEKNGEGRLFSLDDFCSMNGDVKGKVKFNKDQLKIGSKKFTIFNEPQLASANDSIEAPDENNFTSGNLSMRKVIGTMKIQSKGIFTFEETYNLSKYVDF